MEYYMADTYKNYKKIGEPFYNKNGKLATIAECKCDRCQKGIYVCRIENNQPVPHPAYGGVCLKCGGTGIIRKEVRLYTEKEYNTMKKSAEKAKAKKEAEREAKIKAEYAEKKAKWLEKNGFDAEGVTYIITGDSYSIKNELKAAGFKFDPVLLWHRASAEKYEDRVIKVTIDEVIEFSAWGEGHYKTEAKEIIEKKIAATQPQSSSNWVGEIGEKYTVLPATLIKKGEFLNRFGHSNIFTFVDEHENIFIWFTTKNLDDIAINDKIELIGTIKSHNEYKNTKSTILTRCKIVRKIKVD